MRREQRSSAGQVEDQVAFRPRPVARPGQREAAAAAGLDLAERVDAEPEAAERARGLDEGARDRLEAAIERQVVARVGQQHGDRQRIGKPFGGGQRDRGPADHQAAPLGLDIDGARGGRRQQRLGDQGRLLGARVPGFV